MKKKKENKNCSLCKGTGIVQVGSYSVPCSLCEKEKHASWKMGGKP